MKKSIVRKLLGLLFIIGIGMTMPHHLFAADLVYTGFFSNEAVGGYDAVAYFTEGEPQKGSSDYSITYNGAKWLFSSQKNLELFKANPTQYAPQYGGYCAWAVSQGYTAKGDPLFWKVYKGKLYLNYDLSVQNKWQQKIDDYIAHADRQWPAVIE